MSGCWISMLLKLQNVSHLIQLSLKWFDCNITKHNPCVYQIWNNFPYFTLLNQIYNYFQSSYYLWLFLFRRVICEITSTHTSHRCSFEHLDLSDTSSVTAVNDNRDKPFQKQHEWVACYIIVPLFPLRCIMSQIHFLPQPPIHLGFSFFICSAANADPMTNTLELSFFYL